MRLFFALWPPRATAEALHAWASAAQREAGGRVVRAETIHLTLAFLGEVVQERVARALAAAKRVRGEACAFAFALEEARFWAHNRIVWAAPRETPEALLALARGLRSELGQEGFELERRPFAVHITLLRKAHAPRALPSLPKAEWPVAEFALVRSRLAPEGSSYDVVERFALQSR